jgi:two-component system sensor histidine kinase PhoQ
MSALGSDLPAASGQTASMDSPRSRHRRRPISLQTRLLWAASLALAAFLGVTGYTLEQAFRKSALQAMRDRLDSYVFAYLSGTDVSKDGEIILPEFPPDPRFDRPQSGLYAGIVGEGIEWRSASALGRELPFGEILEPGRTHWDAKATPTNVGGVYRYSRGVTYEVPNGGEVQLTFHIAENDASFNRQVRVFRRTLLTQLGGAALVLFLVQLLMLRWSLGPLRAVAQDLARVEQGERERLPDRYPRELAPLTVSINDVIDSEREQRTRYRNTLGDLAHSLKTPLAVIRNELESGTDPAAIKPVISEQVRRMDDIVAYQLARAAASGHATFSAPIEIEIHAESIVVGLEKVYAERGVFCEFDIEPGARFYGEKGDLLELLGNLLENAFKWARSRVRLTARRSLVPGRRPSLSVVVEDDGPGIPEDRVALLLQRGVRGDERVQGHGIGMSIVQDIVKSYRGELKVARSDDLGGARFELRF